ncbi:MAG: sialidase family protein, partial [Calditrichota bacterium]
MFAGWSDRQPSPINLTANPGAVNPHCNSGGRRIIRINNTTIALAPQTSGEKTYRSMDNGISWNLIDSNPTFSSCLITGANEYVYHFYRSDDNIYMVRFKYDLDPPSPVVIYSDPSISETGTGAYRAVNAIVDSAGILFVAAHWGSSDQLYLLRSLDEGTTWDGPFQISTGTGPWYYPHLEVNSQNILMCVYDNYTSTQLTFAKSFNQGETWTRTLLTDQKPTSNPSILTIGPDDIFVFAQSGVLGRVGLVYNHSGNQGNNWDGWTLIDSTCGYADPSPALGNDGNIYVAYRSSNGTGVTTGTCGDQCRSRMAMSRDKGNNWTFPDNYYNAERTGAPSQIRYQTWFNYGGPLEWIWMQYENDGTQHPIYYD